MIRTSLTDDRACAGMSLRARLVEALEIVDALPDEPDEREIGKVVRLWNLLFDLYRSTPRLTAWTATKFYRENPDGTGASWKPAVWTAHVTHERAQEFASAMEQHYIKRSGVDHGDRFRAVRRAAYIADFVPVECSVEEFCRQRLS